MLMIQPDSWPYQNNLVHVCEDFLAPARHLADLAQAVLPAIHEQKQVTHLSQCSKQLLQTLIELRSCLIRVSAISI
jgi:hypothetical protein